MPNSDQNAKPPVARTTLFLIGLTAGVVAACFPRLIPYLSEAEQSVSISLFTVKYIGVASAFSIIIGVSMIWIFMGTKEHTKNLFMSALALPAVLSGGINMSSFGAAAENRIAELNTQTVELQGELERQNSIETRSLDLKSIEPVSLGFLDLFGISDAYAQEQSVRADRYNRSSVKISTESLEQKIA